MIEGVRIALVLDARIDLEARIFGTRVSPEEKKKGENGGEGKHEYISCKCHQWNYLYKEMQKREGECGSE